MKYDMQEIRPSLTKLSGATDKGPRFEENAFDSGDETQYCQENNHQALIQTTNEKLH